MDYATREPMLVVRNIVLENPEIKVRVSARTCSDRHRHREKSATAVSVILISFSQVLGEPKENRKLVAEITMKNPLPETLEDCCFSIEGANLTGGQVISARLVQSLGI